MAQVWAMNQCAILPDEARRYAPDGAYAFARLAVSLILATLIGVSMWAVIVVLPPAQADFRVDRAAASLPYTVMMCALAVSTIALGRMTDRHRIVPPLIISAVALGAGFVLAAYAPNLAVFTAAHALIGLGSGTGFAPMMADISHWFVKRRGLAVVVVAAGNYLAGTVWPFLMSLAMPLIGWRATYAGIGVLVAAFVLPLALTMRRRPAEAVFDEAEAATEAARAEKPGRPAGGARDHRSGNRFVVMSHGTKVFEAAKKEYNHRGRDGPRDPRLSRLRREGGATRNGRRRVSPRLFAIGP
jgi:MFS family permease